MNEQIRDEIRDMAPNLANFKRSNPYKVPEGYFESLPNLIQEKINEENASSDVFGWIRDVLNPKVLVPALVLFIAIGTAWYYDHQGISNNNPVEYLSYDYISNSVYFEDFEDDILFDELLANNNIEDLDDAALFSDQDIENYLMDNQFNEAVILNEL